MFDRDKLRIAVKGIKDNHSEIPWWTRGGVILVDDETITLNYIGTLAVFNRKTVKYYRDRDEKMLVKRIVRIYDEEQDFSVIMYPKAFEELMKVMKENNCEGKK